MLRTRETREAIARRGHEIYEREIRSKVEAGNKGKFVAIDIQTGAYEMDDDDLTASERLLARYPNAEIYAMRVGYPTAYRIGGGVECGPS